MFAVPKRDLSFNNDDKGNHSRVLGENLKHVLYSSDAVFRDPSI